MRWLTAFLLVLLSIMAVHATESTKSSSSKAAKATQAPEMDDDEEDDEEMGGFGWCRDDQRVAAICIACAQLPEALSLPPSECCSDADALEICKNCVDDPVRCLRDVLDIATDGESPQIEDEDMQAYDKRYGKLFSSQKPMYVPDYEAEKRFGTLHLETMGKRFDDEVEKRWGTLNLGSYFNKRYGMLGLGSRNPKMGRRFGTLNFGGLYSNVGKRYGSLNIGKKSDLLSETELEKRYGSLNLGKRYGTLNMGNGYRGPLTLGKRYGTLGMGNTFGYFPYKRSEYVPYNGAIGTDMKKRYGRLFMGRFGGKRLGSANEIRISQIKK
ncbi:uncharacterized protein LOC124258122 [Haliotis rubra]|uniref:uncharacterized protein LOC124258122 n=1 Tax=Haliotis rubra TaxID=36100 RepID=UPI001EE521C0|nr:uncharacterized protein LOC124258122 [Haliotis rubra]